VAGHDQGSIRVSYRLPNTVWLRAFEATARRMSFTAAADELGLTQPAVSQQVKALEGHLGFRLIRREGGRIALTEMGAAYLPVVRKAFEDISASTADLFGARSDRTLTVRATISAGMLWLGPLLPAFRRAYPDISVRLCTSLWADSLSSAEIDVDIRLGDGQWPGCRAELIGRDAVVPVCPPDDPNPPRRVADFLERPLIQVMGYLDLWGRLFRRAGLDPAAPDGGLMVDSSAAAVELVAQGAGCALLIKRHVATAAQAGRLQVPLDVDLPIRHAHYLVVPDDARETKPEAGLFRDWLLQLAGEGEDGDPDS
jgi:LysR family glycine cleavage system transcriptional activator